MSHVPILDKKYILGRGNSKCKDPESEPGSLQKQ